MSNNAGVKVGGSDGGFPFGVHGRSQTDLELVYVSGVVLDQKAHAVPAGLGRHRTDHKDPATDEQQEMIVTANRREENLQNVPMTIQVLTGETLTQLNATTFDDFVSSLAQA